MVYSFQNEWTCVRAERLTGGTRRCCPAGDSGVKYKVANILQSAKERNKRVAQLFNSTSGLVNQVPNGGIFSWQEDLTTNDLAKFALSAAHW